jgi:hypothetical protein
MTDYILFEDAKAEFNGVMQSAAGIPKDAVILSRMAQLLLQKRHKDRSLSFTATRTRLGYDSGGTQFQHVSHVAVYMGGDHIGTVTAMKEHYDITYSVTSPSAERDRPRKQRVDTKNYKSAVAMLDKYLLPIDNLDRYQNEREKLHFMLRNWSTEFAELRRKRDKQIGSIVSTTSQLMEVCSILGAAPPVLEEIKETAARIDLLGPLVAAGAKYNYVHIHNGMCEVLKSYGDGMLKVYPVNTLPPELARKIGMLKVANPEVLIGGVGVKKSDNTFLIIGGHDAH